MRTQLLGGSALVAALAIASPAPAPAQQSAATPMLRQAQQPIPAAAYQGAQLAAQPGLERLRAYHELLQAGNMLQAASGQLANVEQVVSFDRTRYVRDLRLGRIQQDLAGIERMLSGYAGPPAPQQDGQLHQAPPTSGSERALAAGTGQRQQPQTQVSMAQGQQAPAAQQQTSTAQSQQQQAAAEPDQQAAPPSQGQEQAAGEQGQQPPSAPQNQQQGPSENQQQAAGQQGQQQMAAAEPQPPAAGPAASGAGKDNQTVSLIEARRYIGTQVYNGQGDELGEVKRVLPGQGDRAGKIVLEFGGIFGGILGIGQKQVALDWQQFELDPAKDRLILHMTEDELKQLPEYQG